jgi:hypothetical protein
MPLSNGLTQGKDPATKVMLTLLSALNERKKSEYPYKKNRINNILSQNLHIADDLPKMEDGRWKIALKKNRNKGCVTLWPCHLH